MIARRGHLRDILAPTVRELRHRQKLRQEDLARRLGWPLSRVTRLETGDVQLRVDDLPALCRTFGLTLADLLAEAHPDDLDVMGLTPGLHVISERLPGDRG